VRLIQRCLRASLVVLWCVLTVRGHAALAQQLPPVDTTTPAPKLADGTPDLSGVWMGGSPVASLADGLPLGETIPILPEAQAIKNSRQTKDDPVYNCLPSGVPRGTMYPWKIVQTPKRIYFLYEGNIHSYREIYMDRASHPSGDRSNPTWFGDSIGRWDGNTLVVDTVGFNDRTWLDGLGHPHTERLHVVERYTRLNMGTLQNVITIDDPGAYARPFVVTFSARLLAGWELMEYICNENNNTEHLVGTPTRDPRR